MTKVHQIVSDTTLTYHQMMLALARLAESEDAVSLPRTEEELQAMADTYTEGYRIGFVNGGKDEKKTIKADEELSITLLILMKPPPPLRLSIIYPCSGVKRDDKT